MKMKSMAVAACQEGPILSISVALLMSSEGCTLIVM